MKENPYLNEIILLYKKNKKPFLIGIKFINVKFINFHTTVNKDTVPDQFILQLHAGHSKSLQCD